MAPASAEPLSPKAKRVIALRVATARDTTALYECLIAYFAECTLFYPAPVENDVIAWGLNVVRNNGVIVAECDNQIVGSVGLELGAFPWNHQAKYLNGVWLFVTPAFRNGSTGVRLIDAAKTMAEKTGLPLRLDEIWAYHPHLLGKLKERKGFHHVGGNYAYIPNDPNRSRAEF